jgi:hypothetical protein
MRLKADSPRRTDEYRRYFPDWASHLEEGREPLEADHNSYLAGGYAEEFGYLAEPGVSRGVPVLDGEQPEDCPEWRVEVAATHPGYPITPYPIAADREPTRREAAATTPPPRQPETGEAMHGAFFRVTERPYERQRHHAPQRAAAAFTRLLAALLAARWDRSRRRDAGT